MIFIRIEPASGLPIYRQIYDQIRYQVATGTLHAGDQMPSVRQLAHQLAVNQNTVLKVYNQLCQEKILQIERGNGTYVAAIEEQVRQQEKKELLTQKLRELAVQALHFGVNQEELGRMMAEEYEKVQKEINESDISNSKSPTIKPD